MKNPRPIKQIRTRKLGVLIYDSRVHAGRGIDECAAAIGVSPDEYRAFESGTASPSLPQIELLSIYLNVPLEQFWSSQALSTTPRPHAQQSEHILTLRNRVIGASLRMARSSKHLSLVEAGTQSGIAPEELESYEAGEKPIPLPDLEILASILDTPIASFYDQHGPIGKWRAQQATGGPANPDLSPELQAFVAKPVNRPFLDIALKLSDLPADKLRVLAESLLEITY